MSTLCTGLVEVLSLRAALLTVPCPVPPVVHLQYGVLHITCYTYEYMSMDVFPHRTCSQVSQENKFNICMYVQGVAFYMNIIKNSTFSVFDHNHLTSIVIIKGCWFRIVCNLQFCFRFLFCFLASLSSAYYVLALAKIPQLCCLYINKKGLWEKKKWRE